MTDETPAFELPKYNCNSNELVQSIQFLLDTKQWNDYTRHEACESPLSFIKSIDTYRETSNALKLYQVNFDLWIPVNPAPDKKIQSIKFIRNIFRCGLAEAKYSVERSPLKLFSFKCLTGEQEYSLKTRIKEFEAYCGVKLDLREPNNLDGEFDKYSFDFAGSNV